ncbi:MAG: hypothetical protein Q7S31_01980 [bacterium]|nr:hypothetical protein [bacterium]
MKKTLRKITVIYNLPIGASPDDLDTQKSALGVAQGLGEAGYEVDTLGLTAETISAVKKIKADLVFNLVEWAGQDCRLGVKTIKYLELAGVPYTGSNGWGYQLSCDKKLMKQALQKHHLPTPKWQVFDSGDELISPFKYPVIVKPTLEHSAIGISQKSVVTNSTDLKEQVNHLLEQFRQPVLAEEFIAGDEAQVTILEKLGHPWVLPPAVFRYRQQEGYWPINTYEAKWGEGWEAGMSDWVELTDAGLLKRLEDLSRQCYIYLGGRSYPRVDLRIAPDGQVYILEVNNNPGIDFDSESGITVSAKAVDLTWQTLLKNIVEEAFAMGTNTHDAAVL